MAKQPIIPTHLTQRRLRFLGHVSRMEYDRLHKQLLVCAPVDGKQQPEGQKKRWNDVVYDDLEKCSLPSNWRELAWEHPSCMAFNHQA